MLFDIDDYAFDVEHGALYIGDEAMVFHCHHYMNYLLRSILDADYIDSPRFIIGAAADAVYHQLTHLCRDKDSTQSLQIAQEIYQNFGFGLLDLSSMNQQGIELQTTHSFFSKSWVMKFGPADRPIDFYTSGFLAAVYAYVYEIPLEHIHAEQTHCMASGDPYNRHCISKKRSNFATYAVKNKVAFKEVPKQPIGWEHEEIITKAFLGAHTKFVGNEQGLIPAFGVLLVRVQSDYVNRLQIEFMRAMQAMAGDYGETLARELLLEAGYACGFFTYGGVMSSQEWHTVVRPFLESKEDWIKALLSLINTMGWGYHTVLEVSDKGGTFRNYHDFEDMSYLRMYGLSEFPVNWANSGGFTGLMQLIYNTDMVAGQPIETEEGFRQMRREQQGFKTQITKSIACDDDYLEVKIYR